MKARRDFDLSVRSTPECVGPGSYDVSTRPKTAMSVRRVPFGTLQERELFPKSKFSTPSPGAYDPQLISSRAPSYTMSSRSKREAFEVRDGPSPVSYSRQESWVKQTRRRAPLKQERKKPASPNFDQVISYEIRDDGSLKPIRRVFKGEEWIGPGTYSPELTIASSICHSLKESDRRTIFDRTDSNPSPASYSIRDQDKRIKTVIKLKIEEKIPDAPKSGELGPTSWIKDSMKRSPAFESGTKRELFAVTDETPGPMRYQTPLPSRSKSALSMAKQSARFKETKKSSLGPGTYQVQHDDLVKRPSSSRRFVPKPREVHGKYKKPSPDATPGPGQYDP